jgi:peptide/nickel transport system ATP-binding protein
MGVDVATPADVERPLLAVEDLRSYFLTAAGPVHSVDGVSFELDAGSTLGIVGESGSGKSVLCRAIMGLLPRQGVERSGRVLFKGSEVSNLSAAQRRALWGREMSMVFQDPMTSLNPVMIIGKQITESLRLHLGLSKGESRTVAIDLLSSVGIPEPTRRFGEYPHQLSGGMRQRVTIAIALACRPSLLFADEPTTALDVTVQAQILDLLGAEQQERRMAMILVSHDLGVVAGRTDEVAVMYAGKIVEKAPTARLFSAMRMPYTEALFNSMPRLENESHRRLAAIKGRPPSLVNLPAGCRFAPRCPYVQERCLAEEPQLRTDDKHPDHSFACWYPVEGPASAGPAPRKAPENVGA